MSESRTIRIGKGVADALERIADLMGISVHDMATVFCEHELRATKLIKMLKRDTVHRAALDRSESRARLAMKAQPRTVFYSYLGGQ